MQVYHGSWMDHELLISRIRPEVKAIVSEANDDVSVITIPAARNIATSFHPDLLQYVSLES
jgi:hypothetical protein